MALGADDREERHRACEGALVGRRADRLTYGQASIRNVLRLIDFFLIGELMIVSSKRKQRLGDRAANTVVVQRAPRTAVPAPVRGGAEPVPASATGAG